MDFSSSASGNVIQQNDPFLIKCDILAYPKASSYAIYFRQLCPGRENCGSWTSVWNSTQGVNSIHN